MIHVLFLLYAHALPPYQTLSAASQPPLRGFDIKADTTATQMSWAFEAFAKASERLRRVCGGFEAVSKRSRSPRNNFEVVANYSQQIRSVWKSARSNFEGLAKATFPSRTSLQSVRSTSRKHSKTFPTNFLTSSKRATKKVSISWATSYRF